ncbi:MAG: UDP-glucose 4-epimerase GalE [Candidatus Limnocylindrus sp.]
MSDPTTSILLTGGAGYIGAATADALIAAGMRVVILDDLSSGHVDTIPNEASFKTGGYGETDKVAELLRDARIDVIVHCGAKSIVAESSEHPERYFANNVQASLNLLDAACNVGVKRFLFASSAAVYGAPTSSTISETTALNPVNPYGATKVAFELALRSYAEAHEMRAISLRYFNVAGSTERVRERHDPETHLLPRLLHAVETGASVELYGNDYATPDGSALRDYVHVADVAAANLAAVNYLLNERTPLGHSAVNIGSGVGTSVKQAISAVERATKRTANVQVFPRRPGDPPRLIADITRAVALLNWRPRQSETTRIIRSLID